MKESGGWWFTDEEAHFPDWIAKKNQLVDGRLGYQYHKLAASLEFCKSWRVAVDVGGHVGTFAFYLANRFAHVHSFEPVAQLRECFARNVGAENVTLHPVALGAQAARVGMHIVPADTGGTYVLGGGDIEMRTLDSFELRDVDYLKVDCEGGELGVIQGALGTIKRCRPCCMIEQKQKKLSKNFGLRGTPAVDMLKDMGARVVREMSGDYILVFD
jgi:FkbM family methyltransferase